GRNRMATSRKPFPPPCQRPPRDRGPFERECRPTGQLTARDEACGNRRHAFLPWAATPKAGRDPQVRDHRRPQVPADELSPLEKLAVERKVRQHPSNLVCRLLLEKKNKPVTSSTTVYDHLIKARAMS